MVERSSNPHPGFLTFEDGRVPDGDTVPQPPAEPAPPVNFTERLWAVAFVALVAVAIVVGSLR